MRAMYLTGFMGTGKSTIGKLLADKLNLHFIDTDSYIMNMTGKNISEIFEEEGEDKFREYESQVLAELPLHDVIISTGGGIILREDNRKLMKNNGYIINLDCNVETLVARIQQSHNSKDIRPLFQQGIQQFEQRYLSRQKLYYDADFIVNTNNSIEHVLNNVIEWIKKNGE